MTDYQITGYECRCGKTAPSTAPCKPFCRDCRTYYAVIREPIPEVSRKQYEPTEPPDGYVIMNGRLIEEDSVEYLAYKGMSPKRRYETVCEENNEIEENEL